LRRETLIQFSPEENLSTLKTVQQDPAYTPSRGFLLTLAGLLALLHAVLAVTATADKSMTSDELAHLTGGLAYNARGDYRLHPENGNLPQRLASVPMTLATVPLPPTELATWKTADIWNYGHTFFYGGTVLVDQWLFLGRAMIALVSAATGLLVFFWSRALFGWGGGFFSLVLFVFCPTFLAHGALATSDVVMTFFFIASAGAWWWHLQRPGAAGAALSAITLGLAFVAKFSAVLLPPILLLITAVWAAREARRAGWRLPVRRLARTTLLHAAVAWALIWCFYGFRFSAFAPELADGASFNHGWGWTLAGIGFPGKFIWWLKEWRVLPEAWLYGLAFVLRFAEARGAFLSGEYSISGWAVFFPFTFLVKTTVPLLLLLASGTIAGGLAAYHQLRKPDGHAAVMARIAPLMPLAAVFGVYWATSLASNLNIGHRHILPTYPVLFIAAGWLVARHSLHRRLWLAWIGALALWHIAESVSVRPHYLAYFNQIVGGPANGWRHLVDSSLDWGQDLPGLKRWLDDNARGEPVYLAYFGTGDPAYEGIRATALPMLPEVGPPRPWHALEAGVYAISATMLQHVYSSIRGAWTAELETEFQQARASESMLLAFAHDPVRRAELLQTAPEKNWRAAWKRYETLRFARLCHYLRVKPTDAVVGHSMRIYRLDAGEITGATGGSAQAWAGLIEQSVSRH
jgi:4-amino-4-deoxy-L-arabinose transferase-like glycosyltransferase